MGRGDGKGERRRGGRARARRRRTNNRRRRQHRHRTHHHRSGGGGGVVRFGAAQQSCNPCALIFFMFCLGAIAGGGVLIWFGSMSNTALLVFGVFLLVGGFIGTIVIRRLNQRCQLQQQATAANVEATAVNSSGNGTDQTLTIMTETNGTSNIQTFDVGQFFAMAGAGNAGAGDASQWAPPSYPVPGAPGAGDAGWSPPSYPGQGASYPGQGTPYPDTRSDAGQPVGGFQATMNGQDLNGSQAPPPYQPPDEHLYPQDPTRPSYNAGSSDPVYPSAPPTAGGSSEPPPPSYDDVMQGSQFVNVGRQDEEEV